MIKAIHYILVCSIFATACSKTSEKKTPPASIENPVKESELTTIKLTAQAVEWLGIRG